MKKVTWIALLALMLLALLPAAALAAQGDANIALQDDMYEKYQDNIHGGFVHDGELYMYGSNHIFRYRVGDADLTGTELELPPADDEGAYGLEAAFSDGEEICALVSFYQSGENYSIERLEICPIDMSGEKATLGEGMEVDLSELTTDYGDGDNLYLIQINATCCVDGHLMISCYDPSGQEAIYDLDVESGAGKYVEGIDGSLVCATPYEEGQLLIETYDYNSSTCEFLAYEPESESLTSLCAPIAQAEYSYGFNNLAYSMESGRLFYREGGYVLAMENFDPSTAQQVAEFSTLYADNRAGLLLPGDYYAFCSWDGVAVRNTNPGALPERRLVVKQNAYSDSIMAAYNSFGNAHADVAVVLDDSYSEPSALIEAMMNRDDSVDIYMLSVDNQAYDALYNRGYLAELTNPKLTEAVGEMYPFIQDAITKDGAVVALPVTIYGWIPEIDYEGFAQLGYAREDVPTNWKEMIELLPELAGKLYGEDGFYLVDEYSDQNSVRYQLYSEVLDAWRVNKDAEGEVQSYDDPQLAALMEEIAALDLGALGVPEPQDDDEGMVAVYSYGGSDTHNLIQFSTGCTIGNYYPDGGEPTPMSVLPEQTAWAPLDLVVAFVNPFSQNADLAEEYLAELLAKQDDSLRYCLSDRENEPVRDPNYEELLQSWKDELASRQEALESAEAIDRPQIEEEIRSLEELIAYEDRFAWRISPKEIEWYRGHAEQMTVERFDFTNSGDDDSADIYDLRQQMFDGKLSPADFLKELDRQVRMRAMEGN